MAVCKTLTGSENKQYTLKGKIYSPEFIQGPAGKSAYELAVEQGFEGTIDEWLAQIGGIVSHNSLLNRDDNNCHPIKAIEGLEDILDEKQDNLEALDLFEILDILK